MTRAIIQGEAGSNSAAAARVLLGDSVELACCASFRAAFTALDEGRAPCAVLPVENTTAGLVQEVWDRLLGLHGEPALAARAEARVRIAFVAARLPGARPTRILTHPVAAAQCSRFLASSNLEAMPCHDTAGAARLVREVGDPSVAALCPPGAAATYELEVFAAECGDAPRTFTRFLLVTPGDAARAVGLDVAVPVTADDDRCFVALVLPDRPGALVAALAAFAAAGLNLCALHSRAIPGRPGAYAFVVELEAGAARAAAALDALRATGAEARVLGSFRATAWPDAPSSSGVDAPSAVTAAERATSTAPAASSAPKVGPGRPSS